MIALAVLCGIGALVGIALLIAGRTGGGEVGAPRSASVPGVERRRETRAGVLAALALLYGVALVLSLFLMPMRETATTSAVSTPDGGFSETTTSTTTPLIEVSAPARMVIIAAGAVVVVLGLLLGRPPRRILFIAGWFVLGFSVIAMASIGILVLPLAVLLLSSAATAPRHRR